VSRDEVVLHVRSFLDHDRPFIPPSRPANALIEAAINGASDAAYVSNGNGGALVTPSEAFHSLVEHWERWAACLGTHGLLVLEVSNLDVVSTRRYMAESTSMHFDSVQAHSVQMLMPATHFSLGAAAAGLLPAEGARARWLAARAGSRRALARGARSRRWLAARGGAVLCE
jgi:polyketide synthase PksN